MNFDVTFCPQCRREEAKICLYCSSPKPPQSDEEAAEIIVPTPGRYAPRIFTNADHVRISRQAGEWSLKEQEKFRFEYVSESEFDLTVSRASQKIASLRSEVESLKLELDLTDLRRLDALMERNAALREAATLREALEKIRMHSRNYMRLNESRGLELCFAISDEALSPTPGEEKK